MSGDNWDVASEIDSADSHAWSCSESGDVDDSVLPEGLQIVDVPASPPRSPSPAAVALLDVLTPVVKRRGRPPGTRGTPQERAFLRERRDQDDINNITAVATAHPRSSLGSSRATCVEVRPAHSTLATFIQCLGSSAHRTMHSALTREVEVDDLAARADVDYYLGLVPRAAISLNAEALLVGKCRQDLHDDLQVNASIVYFGTRLWVGSLLSKIRGLIRTGIYKPIATVKFCEYDTTPLTANAPDHIIDRLCLEQPSPGTTALASTAELQLASHSSPQTLKVFQADAIMAIVVLNTRTNRITSLQLPLVVPLASADHGTAECMKEMASELTYVPLMTAIEDDFPLNFDLRTLDKDRSNIKTENALNADLPHLVRARLPCRTHVVSTVQKGAYAPVSTLISDMVATQLAMRPGGAFDKLRKALEALLKESVEVVEALAPPECDPATQHREELLNVHLERTPVDDLRGAAIRRDLNSDWELDDIIWYTQDPSPDVKKWATRVARNLLPKPPPLFNRNRWMRSVETVVAFSLLANCHNLLPRVIPIWVALVSGMLMANISLRPVLDDRDAWNVIEDAAAGSDEEAAPHNASKDDWVKYNSKQRKGAVRLARSAPAGDLLVTVISSKPQAKLMTGFLEIDSKSWQDKQFARAVDNGGIIPLLRMTDLYNHRLTNRFNDSVNDLLMESDGWACLPTSAKTLHSITLAFSMISRAQGGIAQLLLSLEETSLSLLFGLLTPERTVVAIRLDALRVTVCMMHPVVKAILDKYPTPAALCTKDGPRGHDILRA